jgi:glutathione S-transferase
VLEALETDKERRTTPWWFGDGKGHADIAVACVLRHLRDAHPAIWEEERWPALAEHAARCEALAFFQEIVQPFIPPQ